MLEQNLNSRTATTAASRQPAAAAYYFDNKEFYAHVQIVTSTSPHPNSDAALSAAIAMARDAATGYLLSPKTTKAYHIRHDADAVQAIIAETLQRVWKAIIRGKVKPPPTGNPHALITQITSNELLRYLGRQRPY